MALTGQLLVPFDPAGLLVRKNADTVLEVMNRQSALGDNPRLLFIAPPRPIPQDAGCFRMDWKGKCSKSAEKVSARACGDCRCVKCSRTGV